ncbi:MAG: hemerythrin family protein [Leptospiraceae bacterium]|nr:hemerythrin family protein [Leptospiraceae bacterium]
MSIKWDDKYKLHISGVDDQHKRLFQLLAESEKLYSNNKGNLINNIPEIKKALLEVEQYTITHFIMEERAMEDTGYPDFESHKAQHLQFIATTQEFLLKLNSDEIMNDEIKLDDFLLRLLTFLSHWITNHIQIKDMEIKPFVKGL